MNRPSDDLQSGPENAGARERLLEAALDVFGELGYRGASTRTLAERAGVNLAAIPYYFSGKRGLYVAVAEHIAASMREALAPATRSALAVTAQYPDPDSLRNALRDILYTLTDTLLDSSRGARWAPFIMREQANPTEAFDVLHREVMAPSMGATAMLLGRLIDRPPDDEATLLTMQMIVGQILVFRTSRAAVVRALGWETYSKERIDAIKRQMWRNVEGIIAMHGAAGRVT